ncbi:MAG TPA: hypothetical protein VM513_35525 [Kofleriaceae bacterium]|nr:hypothetical protein [Kofleriaceae bacterium]
MKAFCAVMVLAACGGNEKAAGVEGSAAKASEAKASEPTPADAGGLPPGITVEMKETFDLYVAAFEKLTAELGAAAPDCAKGVAAVERNAKELDGLDARGAALRAQMEALRERKSPEQAEWFANSYAERVKGAILQMGPLVTSCEGNVALKDAMNSVMARYPMMRKKK